MPQASDESRERYKAWFPDIGCEHATEELTKRGYKLNKDWTWTKPKGHSPTEEETFWICFLIEEWDFGGCD